ncbi:uncharacterized protein JCM15063_000547 [Sporobolomyces koalae]|uniref:uncharacterized protein n=1 Tax=Sporobolomyces koalae TaxID=500713 RepID=UPI0031797FE1
MSLVLQHLHLNATPISSLPTDPSSELSEYRESLLNESLKLLDSDAWTGRKEFHGGVVETFDLPVEHVRYKTKLNGADEETVSPTGKSDGEGITWHKRISRLKTSEYGGYDEWWAGVGANHTAQEKEYVDNLKELIDIGQSEDQKECFLKLYKLPFGATDRSFMCRSLVIKPDGDDNSDDGDDKGKEKDSKDEHDSPLSSEPGSRSFLSFSLPITTNEPHPAEKKYVRGTTVTVERIEEADDGETIVWSCASLSTPGGSIPVKLGESKMAASLADAVPPILEWMKKAHPKGSGPDVVPKGVAGGSTKTTKEASEKAPVSARITRDVKNPGGGMGLMAAGRLTLDMFQRPVKLREF